MFLSLSEYFSFSRILCQDAGWGSNPPSNFKSCLDDLQWTHNGDTDEGGISKYLKLPPSCFDFGSHLSRICRLFVTPFMNYRETKFENIPHLTSKMLRWYNMHDNLWQGKTWIRKKEISMPILDPREQYLPQNLSLTRIFLKVVKMDFH